MHTPTATTHYYHYLRSSSFPGPNPGPNPGPQCKGTLDFIELQNIQLVASMNPSTTVGRYPLSTRFTANARLAYVAYPEKEALFSV